MGMGKKEKRDLQGWKEEKIYRDGRDRRDKRVFN